MKALTELKAQICREKSIAALRTMGHAGQALQNSAETIDRGSPEGREVGICLLLVAYPKQRKKGVPERLLATVDTSEEGRLAVKMPCFVPFCYKCKIIFQYLKRMSEEDDVLKQVFLFGASTRLTRQTCRRGTLWVDGSRLLIFVSSLSLPHRLQPAMGSTHFENR